MLKSFDDLLGLTICIFFYILKTLAFTQKNKEKKIEILFYKKPISCSFLMILGNGLLSMDFNLDHLTMFNEIRYSSPLTNF